MFLPSDCTELVGGLEDMSRRTKVVLWEQCFCRNAGDFLACFERRLHQYHGVSVCRKGRTRVAKKA